MRGNNGTTDAYVSNLIQPDRTSLTGYLLQHITNNQYAPPIQTPNPAVQIVPSRGGPFITSGPTSHTVNRHGQTYEVSKALPVKATVQPTQEVGKNVANGIIQGATQAAIMGML